MQRQMLRLTLVLGVMVTLLGGTGVFAVFTDSADGGNNSVISGARPSAADVQIAPGTLRSEPTGDSVVCSTFVEATTTPQFTISDFQPSSATTAAWVCLRNIGASPLELTAQAIGLLDVDTGCTGDEAASGDATCGGGLQGELAPLISIEMSEVGCATNQATGGFDSALTGWASQGRDFGASELAPGATACVLIEASYGPATATQVQQAQSDRVNWSFRFVGTAS